MGHWGTCPRSTSNNIILVHLHVTANYPSMCSLPADVNNSQLWLTCLIVPWLLVNFLPASKTRLWRRFSRNQSIVVQTHFEFVGDLWTSGTSGCPTIRDLPHYRLSFANNSIGFSARTFDWNRDHSSSLRSPGCRWSRRHCHSRPTRPLCGIWHCGPRNSAAEAATHLWCWRHSTGVVLLLPAWSKTACPLWRQTLWSCWLIDWLTFFDQRYISHKTISHQAAPAPGPEVRRECSMT